MLFVNNQWLLNFATMRFLFLFMFVFYLLHSQSSLLLWIIIVAIIDNYGGYDVGCMSSVCHHSRRVGFFLPSPLYVVSRFFVFLDWYGAYGVVTVSCCLYLSVFICCGVGCPCTLSYVLVLRVKVTECLRWFDIVISSLLFVRSVNLLFPSNALSFRFLVPVHLSSCFCSFVISFVLGQSLSFQMFISSTWCFL